MSGEAKRASGPQTYVLGAPVSCEDGPCGELSRIVVDPISRIVTHLIVEPRHRHARARLVPVSMLHIDTEPLLLRCTLATYRALQYAEETEFLPRDAPLNLGESAIGMGYPGTLAWPYYSPVAYTVQHERIPLGEVEVRRGEPVHAECGVVGRVEGLVLDSSDRQVTHVLLQHGHLWGAKSISIPIGSITSLDHDGAHTSLSKYDINALPEIEVARHGEVTATHETREGRGVPSTL